MSIQRLFKRAKKALFKRGFALANTLLIVAVLGIVWNGHNGDVKSVNLSLLAQPSDSQSAPLDLVSKADIAANIATVVSLPETIAIINQADSLEVFYLANSVKIDNAIVTKPQIVTGGSQSRKDIQHYTAQSGDTVSSLVDKFGVSSDSIKWSNGLWGNYIPSGQELVIPPVDGIVYKVRSGDNVDAIVSRFQARKDLVIAFNDIELSGLPVDEYIVIPDGVQPYYSNSYANIFNFTPAWSGNGYYYGYCTYYSAMRVKVPSNWGNANTWDDYARLSGWIVSSTPVVGAVAQSDFMSSLGHVAVVDEVSPDGTMMKYSDMNALCGWGCEGHSNWVPISTYPNYIYH